MQSFLILRIVSSAALCACAAMPAARLHAQTVEPASIEQNAESARVARTAAELLARVRAEFECEVDAAGLPRFDEFSNAWLVAFTATGSDCDEAAAELIARGKEVGAAFYRRPDRAQVRALVAELRRTVQRGFSCPISVRGEPQLDESSGDWVVNVVASGPDCDDATAELERQGAALQIRISRVLTHQELRGPFR